MQQPARLVAVVSGVLSLVIVACQSAPAPAPTQVPAKPTPIVATAPPAASPSAPTAAPAKAAFPNRPVEFIVSAAPGGGSSITAETINKIIVDNKLSPQPINISYKPGASGAIGYAYVSGRRGDGHVINTAVSSLTSSAASGQSPLDPVKDFTPIALMAVDELLMACSVNAPYQSFQDVLNAAKANPGKIKVAGTSAFGAEAAAASLIEQSTGVKLNLIPFNSGAEVLTAVLGNQVDVAIANPNELFPNIQGGKLRPVVAFGEKRMSALPNMPTAKELGVNAVIFNPRGIISPPAIAASEQDWWIGVMKKVTETAAWQEYAGKNMMTVKFLAGAEYGKYIADEFKMYKDLYASLNPQKK